MRLYLVHCAPHEPRRNRRDRRGAVGPDAGAARSRACRRCSCAGSASSTTSAAPGRAPRTPARAIDRRPRRRCWRDPRGRGRRRGGRFAAPPRGRDARAGGGPAPLRREAAGAVGRDAAELCAAAAARGARADRRSPAAPPPGDPAGAPDRRTTGVLGEPLYFESTRETAGAPRTPGSAWWALAPHDVSLALHLFGGVPADRQRHRRGLRRRTTTASRSAALRVRRRTHRPHPRRPLRGRKSRRMSIAGTRRR